MSKKRTATVQSRPGSSKRSTPPGRRPPTIRRSGLPGWVLPVGMTVVALVVIFLALILYSRSGAPTPSGSSSSSSSSSSLPATAATGQTVNGIQCQTSEQVLFHIHAHLAIFGPNSQPVTVPMGIGIPNPQTENTTDGPFVVSGSCFYWLHSHATDGIVHVESPIQRTYTLGDYFDIWGEQLSPTQVGSDKGTVTAYVNGQQFTGNPRDVPLTAHAVIQLDVGSTVAPRPYTFAQGL